MRIKKGESDHISPPEASAALQLPLESPNEAFSNEAVESVTTGSQTVEGGGQEQEPTGKKTTGNRNAPRKGEEGSNIIPAQGKQEMEQGLILEAQEFWELWLPYELEIVQAVSGFYIPIEGNDGERRQAVRRSLLSRLWIETQNGGEQARNILEVLGSVMEQFIHEVRDIVVRGEFEGRDQQTPQAPGTLALQRLIGRRDFLQHATAYTSSFQAWLLDLAASNQLGGIAEPETPVVEPQGSVVLLPRRMRLSLPPSLPSPSSLTPIVEGPNFPGDRDLHRGLALKNQLGAWRTNEHQGTKYFEGKSCTVTYRPDELFPESWYQTREVALRQLDRRFCEMRNDLAADMLDIMFHHWLANHNSQQGNKATITLSQTCEYRGILLEKKSLLTHWLAIRDARSLRLTANGVDLAVLELDAALIPQLSLWGQEDVPRADMVYIYSPGFFISQALQDNLIYVAPYVRNVWELDPYREITAKRLARYLRGEWRLNTQAYLRDNNAQPTRWRMWKSILSDAGIPIQGHLEGKDPRRLRQNVEAALETLYDLEAIRECGPTVYHPEDQIARRSLPRRGGTLAWLNLRVCLDPAADIMDALEDTDRKRRAWSTQAPAVKQDISSPKGRKSSKRT